MRLILCSLVFLAACGGEKPTPPARALVWARSADSATLDPAEAEWGEDLKVIASLYEPLVSFDSTGAIEPRLATSWTFSEDGLSATFDLRSGVLFHDGTSFEAASVLFTFNRILDASHPQRPRVSPYAANFRDIDRVEAIGATKVLFHLKRPTRLLLHALALSAGSIVSPTAVRAEGPRFAQHPSGTGPFKLGRWERDVRMELDRYSAYWGLKPAVERVMVIPVPSSAVALQKLRKGEAHAADHLSPADARSLEKDPSARALVVPAVNICCLGFNMTRPPYNNVHFRRAVSLAIDRKALIAYAYEALAEPAASVVPPVFRRDLEPLPDYEFDLARARDELALAKLASNQVELMHVTIPRPYMPSPERVAEFLRDQLRKIGLVVKLTAYDKGAYGERTRDRSHPMFLLGWKGDAPDPDNYLYPLLHGDNDGDQKGSFFHDAAFDRAVTGAQTERDPARRRSLYAEAFRRYREELPTLPLVHAHAIYGLAQGVDYTPHPLEIRFASARFR